MVPSKRKRAILQENVSMLGIMLGAIVPVKIKLNGAGAPRAAQPGGQLDSARAPDYTGALWLKEQEFPKMAPSERQRELS